MEAYSENAMETTGRLPRLAVAEAIARALGLVPSWLSYMGWGSQEPSP